MKKLVRLIALFGMAALVLLLAVGSVGADSHLGEGEVEPEPGGEGEAEAEPEGEAQPGPEGTATRIDFEQSDDSAVEGLYVVQETGGSVVASWYAMDGWRDSGWLNHLNLTHESVWV
jgi:hypothetical protein